MTLVLFLVNDRVSIEAVSVLKHFIALVASVFCVPEPPSGNGTVEALYLQSQTVNIGADLEGGRLVGLNISQSEDSKYSTLTN